MSANLENSAVAIGLEKVSFHSNAKECSNYHTKAFHMLARLAQNPSSWASAVCELGTSRCSSWFSKRQRNQRANCQHSRKSKEIGRKQGNSRKTSTSASLIMLKPLTLWITTNCGKFFKWWEHQTTLPASWETRTRSNSQTNRLVQNWEGSTWRLYIVTLLI